MWGSDFPHAEGSYPHSREYISKLFEGVAPTERLAIVRDNAARFLGFDIAQLATTAAASGA
jgi:predicted TIM-barrel fold metal-dependent hydrolase